MPPAARSALITGASRGIGAAIARALSASGVRVILVARTAHVIEEMARELGGGALSLPCDLTNSAAVAELAARVENELGGAPDILVNNAGVFDLAPLGGMSEALFVSTIQTNLIAPFILIRTFAAGMQARGSGHIVTIGSIADRSVMPGNGAYSPAKYGLRALHEVLRLELRGTGVRATLVSPGPVDTHVWDDMLAQDHEGVLPSRDVMLSPQAVADAVVYTVSQPASVNIDELRLSHT